MRGTSFISISDVMTPASRFVVVIKKPQQLFYICGIRFRDARAQLSAEVWR